MLKRFILFLVVTSVCALSSAQTPNSSLAEKEAALSADGTEKKPFTPSSNEDLYILNKGEVSNTRYVFGTILAIVPGFGVGHAVNKQFGKSGWIFLAGEGAGVGLMYVGALTCIGDSLFDEEGSCNNSLMDIGVATFLGFKVWEIVDAIIRPPKHNARYRELIAERKHRNAFFIVPRTDSIGANLVYTF